MLRKISRLITIGFCLSLTRCHWNDPPATDTIVFALSSEPKTLDPRYATDANGQRIDELIFSSIVTTDNNLEVVGLLATSWTYSNLKYEFRLRPGLKFHNDRWVTTEDFLFSVSEYQKKRSPFSAQFSAIDKVEGAYSHIDGGTLILHMKTFAAPFLNDLPLLKLLPAEEVQKAGNDFYKNPIGTGPFKFAKRDLNNIFLKRSENYFGVKPLIAKVQFKVIKDSNTRFQKMYKGQIDIVQSDIPYSKVKFFKQLNNFNVVVEPGLSTTYILLNLRHPLLAKKEVRLALSAAINREELIRYTHEGYAEPATSIITSIHPFFHSDLKYAEMSNAHIKQVFSQFKDEDIILKTSNTQEAIENGKVITNQLKSLGLPVKQQTYEWGTYYQDVRTGKFDIAIMKWVGISDPDIYRISLHSEMTPPGRNRGYYSNPQFDKLVVNAFKEPNSETRKNLYKQAQEIIFKDQPTIPLWYEKQVAITHQRVKNYKLPRDGDFNALMKVYKK